MRCKNHQGDATSTVGVCATCLRERLLAVIAAQLHAQQLHRIRKSDVSATWQNQRFYPTPHVGTTSAATAATVEAVLKQDVGRKSSSNGGGKFSSLFSGLFRSKSAKPDLNPGAVPDPGDPTHSCASSPSWFSRQKKKKIDQTYDEHCCYGDESSSYSSAESSQSWWNTPRRTASATLRRGHIKNVSGLAFCLSPLVRAGPKTRPPEMLVVPAKSYLSTSTSFCKNRSRKLADFGRYK